MFGFGKKPVENKVSTIEEGTVEVIKTEQQHGYICKVSGGRQLFFHVSGCVGGVQGFNAIREAFEESYDGDRPVVLFESRDTDKGLMLVNIRLKR